MKKNKIEAIADSNEAKLNPSKESLIRAGQYARRGIVPRKFTGPLPSPMELATLAATLYPRPDEHYEKICATALNLWITAQETIGLQQQCNEDDQHFEAARKSLPGPAENQDWPISLDKFCKILWPEKDTGDRAEIIRAWLKSLPDGVSYAAMNGEPIEKNRFYFLRNSILRWYPNWKDEQTSARRSEAAKRRHRKARPPREKLNEIVQELKEA